jgi:hypothetical protein
MATSPHATQSPGYERSDASPRGLIYFVLTIAAVLAVVSLFLIWLFKHYQKIENPGSFVATPFEAVQPLPPPPRIQPDPSVDIRNYLQSQQNVLNTYGWIDRQAGIVRMPIDRAMELVLERGLPARSTNTPQNGAAREEQNREQRNAESKGGGQ